jgi:AcrR family transcriptional regulator
MSFLPVLRRRQEYEQLLMLAYSHSEHARMTPAGTPLGYRKRPRQARAVATADVILEAAVQLLAKHGLGGFNTNAVAATAGVSVGTLYQYFANKAALMAAVIAQRQRMQSVTLAEAFAGLDDMDLDTAVRVLVRAAMRHHHDDPLLATAIDHEEARLPVAPAIAEAERAGGALVAAFLARHAADIAVPPAVAARTVPPMVRAVVDAWANRTPPDLDRAESEAVRAVLGYLRMHIAC